MEKIPPPYYFNDDNVHENSNICIHGGFPCDMYVSESRSEYRMLVKRETPETPKNIRLSSIFGGDCPKTRADDLMIM